MHHHSIANDYLLMACIGPHTRQWRAWRLCSGTQLGWRPGWELRTRLQRPATLALPRCNLRSTLPRQMLQVHSLNRL